ncbi:tRNA lysidine(34) synthetase TilS [Adhaeribacter pallidiroseus]|uniref:tRNA(Ile)-lysidine synthase n=1 Tax=Adhaeribacter pallidiroseus TaxID=2072847 RepID=A0A369QMU2_9BACT|nr:tRNA lysidine(34) synthetase TilS [Adhaeribacter pallidiroseus]RDC66064.1 tRNA(Ile)-lysidine synthetase [Adhaeribacter pallidiroseus]
MIEKVLTFAQQYQLFTPDHQIIAAVSGGIDSVVLCDLLAELNLKFAIAHANFGLRGEESDADELFVKKLAKKYNVAFYSEHFNTKAFAAQEKISTQMAARTLRYTWFENLRQQLNYDRIVVAHHQSDTVETILLNLTRGTGLPGLHGIAPKNGYLIRPLLCLRKDDIYDYVTTKQLIWREDSSNETTVYQRNKIRHEVIPVLKQLNPNLEHTVQQTAAKISAAEILVNEYVQKVREQVLRTENGITYLDIAGLPSSAALPLILFELLQPYGFSFELTQSVIGTFAAESGKLFESVTHTLVKDREQLVITAKNLQAFGSYEILADQKELIVPDLQLSLTHLTATNYKITTGKKVAALDYNLLQFPLKIRTWKEGDWFVPLGMNGKKKISDFLIDEKVPVNLKDRVRVLTSNNSIAWIIGYRLDNRFKITDKTEQVLEMKIK